MKTIQIIANRAAKSGLGLSRVRQAKRAIWGWPCEFSFPSSAEETRAFCEGLDPEKTEAVVVIGGDGTVNLTLPALMKKRIPLYPYPGGTANDLATELGISDNWEAAQELIDQKLSSPMDLITANGVPFATVAGIGIGALLTREFNERRSKSSLFRWLSQVASEQMYPILGAKTILTTKKYVHRLQVRTDRLTERLNAAAVFICNQSSLGGNLKVAPEMNENNDKRFHVLLITRSHGFNLLRAMMAIRAGQTPDDFVQFSTDRLVLEDLDGRSIQVFGDGEVIVSAPKVEFKLAPDTLQVYRGRKGASS